MATDGTPAGTHSLLAGMADPPQSIDKLTAIGDRAVFTGFTQANGNELWVTDGTPAGTHLLVELAPGTASIAAFGLVPLLFATGPGSEIQRPLAIVVIGGLVSSTVLTLVLVPVLYDIVERLRERRATRRAAKGLPASA
jgi:cobalt-zinc-cadmium resistance protein CzcA